VESGRNHVGDIHQSSVLLRFFSCHFYLVECLLEQVSVNSILCDVF
jgi:hypothetical protein